MQRLRVVLREAAIADLKEIYTYIAEQGHDPATGHRFVTRIKARLVKIGDAPHGGVSRPDLGTDLRLVPFERSTVIIYRVREDRVEIVAIVYGGRDYEALIQER
jgi:toxin ParE1/3/4